jgi:hypothetical protein
MRYIIFVHLAPDSESGARKTKVSYRYKTRKTNREKSWTLCKAGDFSWSLEIRRGDLRRNEKQFLFKKN